MGPLGCGLPRLSRESAMAPRWYAHPRAGKKRPHARPRANCGPTHRIEGGLMAVPDAGHTGARALLATALEAIEGIARNALHQLAARRVAELGHRQLIAAQLDLHFGTQAANRGRAHATGFATVA